MVLLSEKVYIVKSITFIYLHMIMSQTNLNVIMSNKLLNIGLQNTIFVKIQKILHSVIQCFKIANRNEDREVTGCRIFSIFFEFDVASINLYV